MPAPLLAIVAGEASGEMYGAQLAAALRQQMPEARLFGIGGEHMEAAGVELIAHIRDLAVVGITEVVAHLPRVYGIYRRMVRELRRRQPALLIPIDFPDFNLRLARHAKALGIPVSYFIAPQVWAWRKGRVKTMRRIVDQVISIIPFEEAFFQQAGIPVNFVGHPLVETVRQPMPREEFFARNRLTAWWSTLCLLPGSRVREVERHLPEMLEALALLANKRPIQATIIRASNIERSLLEQIVRAHPLVAGKVVILDGPTYAALGHADAAVVASGTATVEAALLGTPMVVIYRVSRGSWWLGKLLVDTPFYCMVNLIAQRAIVPELIQDEFTAANVAREVESLLASPEKRETMRAALAGVRAKLGEPGAIGRAAKLIVERLAQR